MQRKPKNYMENSDSSDLVEWGVSVETPLPPKTEIKKNAFF